MLRARAALRDGLAVYLTGDIPWPGPNARPGRLLGQPQRFLSVWADLAVLARAPVFLVFCTHRPGGRFALTIEPPWTLAPGDEPAAVARYLRPPRSRDRRPPRRRRRPPPLALLRPCGLLPDSRLTTQPESAPFLRARSGNSPGDRKPHRNEPG